MIPASFQRAISSHEQPSSSSTSSVCAPASCAGRRTAGGSPANWTGFAHTPHGPLGCGRLEQVAVGLDLRVLGQVERALQWRPDAFRAAQDVRHSSRARVAKWRASSSAISWRFSCRAAGVG